MKRNNIINEWLKEKGDPEIELLVKRNVAIANKVRGILESRKMDDADLAKIMGKYPSEISKWLSGAHNLTQRSIVKMELALGVQLLYVEVPYKYVYLGKVDGGSEDIKKKYSESAYETSAPAYAS